VALLATLTGAGLVQCLAWLFRYRRLGARPYLRSVPVSTVPATAAGRRGVAERHRRARRALQRAQRRLPRLLAALAYGGA
jgi:hypothetical protein